MRRSGIPHWIRHDHLFDPDEYECSQCSAKFKKKSAVCPNCGVALNRVETKDEWLDEEEELSLILDDD